MADAPKSHFLSAEVHEYLVAHGTPPDGVLRALQEETRAIGPIATVPVVWPNLSTLYYYARNSRALYVGQYLQHEPPPVGPVVIIE